MTTLKDLFKTAFAAAEAVEGKDQFTIEQMKVQAFTAAGHAVIDYPRWENFFNDARATFRNLAAPAPSATAAAQNPSPAPAQTAAS
jgi:hypothetical protein